MTVDQNVYYIEYQLINGKTGEICGTYNSYKRVMTNREIAIYKAKKAGEEKPYYFIKRIEK